MDSLSNNQATRVSLKEILKDTKLHSRDQAEELLAVVMVSRNNNQNLLFDFSEIEFVSRSFADEFYKQVSRNKIRLRIINIALQPKNMLTVVRRTYKRPRLLVYSKRKVASVLKTSEMKIRKPITSGFVVKSFDTIESVQAYFQLLSTVGK